MDCPFPQTAPHAAGCKADQAPTLLGLAYYCPLCKRRLSFLSEEDGMKAMLSAAKDMFGGKQ